MEQSIEGAANSLAGDASPAPHKDVTMADAPTESAAVSYIDGNFCTTELRLNHSPVPDATDFSRQPCTWPNRHPSSGITRAVGASRAQLRTIGSNTARRPYQTLS